MKLLASKTSPYARKVRIAFAEKKIEYTLIEQNPWEQGNVVGDHNPLGKVPVLVLEDGTNLFDSRVIVEYIDLVSPVSRLIPEPTRQRILVKRWEALGDGLMDAAVGARLEAMRPKRQQSAENLERQMGKMRTAVDAMSRDLGDRAWCNGEAYTLADIATGVALAYLDFRHPEFAWRDSAPNLARQLQKLAKRPSFDHTQP
ncbi:MAG: glutathione S-transferase N-terminal domain-containing protein [Burkholderiales bacterium]|nr:glutathione S-transferase N-terminal domain-containing protein [Burkholderiales bacterium]